MAAGVINIAKGRAARYGDLPEANDEIFFALLSAAEADATLIDYDDLGALLGAAGNTEAAFTGYSRQVATGVTVTVDDTNDRVEIDADDPVWNPTSAEALVKLLVCYDADNTAGTDANVVVLTHDDFALTTGTTGDLTYQVAATGFYRAS